MADDDNFDIDIYGEDAYPESGPQQDATVADSNDTKPEPDNDGTIASTTNVQPVGTDQAVAIKQEPQVDGSSGDALDEGGPQQIASTGGSAGSHDVHRQAPQKQGTKRKQGDDDERPTDPGATAALMINDVNWWVGEEDIRGWANQSGCEDELIEVTFNEHKVNGKSKGYASNKRLW